jgi:hypothetical protein
VLLNFVDVVIVVNVSVVSVWELSHVCRIATAMQAGGPVQLLSGSTYTVRSEIRCALIKTRSSIEKTIVNKN